MKHGVANVPPGGGDPAGAALHVASTANDSVTAEAPGRAGPAPRAWMRVIVIRSPKDRNRRSSASASA